MSESNSTGLCEILQQELRTLSEKCRSLKVSLEQAETNRHAVRHALIALGCDPDKRPKKRKKMPPSVDFITQIAEMTLSVGPRSRKHLKAGIKELQASRGYKNKGYSAVFREAMKGEQFGRDDEGNVIFNRSKSESYIMWSDSDSDPVSDSDLDLDFLDSE
ncbi:MAG: hypothetical protein GXP26_10650 [Planctomycetes bacterium]|nr:hypothetical protein [Planctomycetota bacterium]